MKKYDYLVVGSGLYGAVFAHEAKARGKSVLVAPYAARNNHTPLRSEQQATISWSAKM